jgi:hypothetical protein
MSLTTSPQDWLEEGGPRAASALTARRHVAAETSTDVDAICATVSADPFFALPVRTRTGHELRAGSVLTDASQVRGYYAGRSGSYVVVESRQLTSLATDWYVCNETAATLRGTGDVNGVDATGKEWVVRSAVLFPTAADGILGEICATRDPMDDVLLGTVTTTPGDAVENARLLDRVALAARDQRWDAVGAELAEGHTLAVRVGDEVHVAEGRRDATSALTEILGGAPDLTLLHRVATDWFTFAEYLLAGSGRRVALLQPVEDGRLQGTFGYGL